MDIKKIVIVPDSFKGTLSSKQICEIVKSKISSSFPLAKVIAVPIADGGEGTVDCFLNAVGGQQIECETVNPFFEKMVASYGILSGNKIAVIEMAACAGLPLVEDRKNPMLATTYGVGVLITDAIERGVKEIVLGLGGSATNDFGCGAAAALGVQFYNVKKENFIPVGETLSLVEEINAKGIIPSLKDIKITVMCDVDNPVFGPNGAAYVYAPQKGATPDQVEVLNNGLKHICQVVEGQLGKTVSALVGGGAAGAMAGGMYAFCNATISKGIEVLLDTVRFESLIENADLIITGEGKMDEQSLQGKVISGVARRAKKKGVPVIAIVGGVEGEIGSVYEMGVNSIFTINQLPEDFSISRFKSKENLERTLENVFRLLTLR